MVLFGYCYFTVLALVAASGVNLPIQSRQTELTYGIAIKCLPGVVLCGYAWSVTSGICSLLWFFLVAYHTGSLLFSFVLLGIIRRSRYKDQLHGDPQDLTAKESPKAQMLRRAYGSTVYLAQLGFWYLSFGI